MVNSLNRVRSSMDSIYYPMVTQLRVIRSDLDGVDKSDRQVAAKNIFLVNLDRIHR
ncbi:MAG: hypothetical protein LH631_06990 [Alkalinema sp. CAN_BIN05]|nr:hypothetical protein [Alkalinema sp. CAN_BIN05]